MKYVPKTVVYWVSETISQSTPLLSLSISIWLDDALVFNFRLLSTIVWNIGIPVIVGIIGWGGPSRMNFANYVGIFDESSCTCDTVIVINKY